MIYNIPDIFMSSYTLLIVIYINAFIDIIYDEMSGTCIDLSTLHPHSLPHLWLVPRSPHFFPEASGIHPSFLSFSGFSHISTLHIPPF